MEKTTIQISMNTLERLRVLKSYNRESYDELISGILENIEEEILSEQEIMEIKESLEEVRKGQVYSIDEVAKELKIDLK